MNNMKFIDEGLKDYLESLKSWDGKHAFGLEGIKGALEFLGHPERLTPSVHVAGTNGKGSTCLLLAGLLGSWDKKVGCYLSPPLGDDRHRFIVDGRAIGAKRFNEEAGKLAVRLSDLDTALSLFEFYQILSFYLFEGLDCQVVEVGLGGRLDASNVLTNKLFSVITSVALDHEHLLGESIAKIAKEKAGIITGTEPVVIGRLCSEAKAEIEAAVFSNGNKLYQFGVDFEVLSVNGGLLRYSDSTVEFEFGSKIIGVHQYENMGVAIFIARMLGVPVNRITKSLANLSLPGRFEVVEGDSFSLVLDTAHNPHAVRALCSSLEQLSRPPKTCLFAVYRDKNWKQMLDLLSEHIVNWNIVCVNEERGVAVDELNDYLSSLGVTNIVQLDSLADFKFSEDTLVTGSAELVNILKLQQNNPDWHYWNGVNRSL